MIKPDPKKLIQTYISFLGVKVSMPNMTPKMITMMGFRFKIIANTERGMIFRL